MPSGTNTTARVICMVFVKRAVCPVKSVLEVWEIKVVLLPLFYNSSVLLFFAQLVKINTGRCVSQTGLSVPVHSRLTCRLKR